MPYRYANYRWTRTSAPVGPSRYDDIWFHDEHLGWAINADGQILRTENGGQTWVEQARFPYYLRSIAFADRERGWVGTFDPAQRLLQTTDGGVHWTPVLNLPVGGPPLICGLCVADAQTVYAAGTNQQTKPVGLLKSTDGGGTWHVIDMSPWAASLIDILFIDANTGWTVGGRDTVMHPARAAVRGDLIPVVLHTTDGGKSWTNRTSSIENTFPQGEWGWKIQRVNAETMFVSLQNYRDGAILRSDDGGRSWVRLRLNDRQRNSNLEGVGFLDESRGWVGGWGDLNYKGGYTSETWDRGSNWTEANLVGRRLNRFRFIGDPPRVAYASGDTVYKFTDAPSEEPTQVSSGPRSVEATDIAPIDIQIPEGTRRLVVRIWDRFGDVVRVLVDEQSPQPGERLVGWNFRDDAGEDVPAGAYIVRVTLDDEGRSVLTYRVARPETANEPVPGGAEAAMLGLIALRREAAALVHGSIPVVDGRNLGQLFGARQDREILDFLIVGTSTVSPYVGQPLVVPGDPDASVLVKQITRGAMAGLFSADEQQIVRHWILELGRDRTPVQANPELVAKARTISSVEALRETLQGLLKLELSTLPVYLTAMYSLDRSRNGDIRRRLRAIAVDEMVHMGLVANLLRSVGGRPRMTGTEYVPTYPASLPFGIAGDLMLNLEPFSKALVGKILMRLELPLNPLQFPEVQDITADTIGEVYTAVALAIEKLGEGIFEANAPQVEAFGGRVHPVRTVSEARVALDRIAIEGEGRSTTPFPDGPTRRPAHYYALEAIYRGMELVEIPDAKPPFGYARSRPIHFESAGVYQIPRNPVISDYSGEDLARVRKFAQTYSQVLDALEASFNGEPSRIDIAVDRMVVLGELAEPLVSAGLGLVFAWIPEAGI